MGLMDRILGRKVELEKAPVPAGMTIADARAVDRYQQMLRTAPTDVIERAHVEAFERLTPAQLDLLFERLTADAEQNDERPVDAKPASLARSTARAGRRFHARCDRLVCDRIHCMDLVERRRKPGCSGGR